MIETSTTSSSFPHSKRKSKIATMLVVLGMFFAAFVMTRVVKYDAFATIPTETNMSPSTNASSTKEALIMSRVLQGGGPPGGQTGGQQPLDKLLIAVTAVKTDTESIITNALETDKVIAKIDTDVAAVKTDTESIIVTAEDIEKYVLDLHSSILIPPRVQFSTSQNHCCAIYLDSVKCLGNNWFGQLGIDSSIKERTSVPIPLILPLSLSPVKVVAGNGFTCILTNVKTVFCVGSNNHGQLGHGESSEPNSYDLVQVVKANGSPLQDVIDIEAGPEHTCATHSTGSIYCWGRNDVNELGWNDEEVDVKMLALAAFGTCIVKSNFPSHVYCKGARYKPMYDMGEEVMKITASSSHLCVLLANHRAKCAGFNSNGQLGNGVPCTDNCPFGNGAVDVLTSISDSSPLSGITDISAGDGSTCVLVNGQPMCFGDNKYYQLGIARDSNNDGQGDDVLYPTALDVTLPSDKEAVSIYVEYMTSQIVFSDNSIYAWGKNSWGTLGDKSEDFSKVIGGVTGDAAVAMQFDLPIATESILDKIENIETIGTNVGLVKTDTESIITNALETDKDIAKIDADIALVKTDTESIITNALETDKDIAKIDADVALVKTDTESIIDSVEDVDKFVSDLHKLKLFPPRLQLSLSALHLCAVLLDSVQCVGYNDLGQLGVDPSVMTKTSIPIPLILPLSLSPVKVVTGARFTCILTNVKTVFCVGSNNHGQLGHGESSEPNSYDLVQVVKANGSPLQDVIDIEAGPEHTCATHSTGSIYCWGRNDVNELGWNDEEVDVKMLALAAFGTCIVKSNFPSHVYCKGARYKPMYDMGEEVMKITASSSHLCVLLANHRAKCAGWNEYGQLGNGVTCSYGGVPTCGNDAFDVVTSSSDSSPLSGITDIFAGGVSTCVLVNGQPLCFGNNWYFQLGIVYDSNANGQGDDVLFPTPLHVTLPSNKEIVSIHVTHRTGHIVFSDNSIYAWGNNAWGTIGDKSEDFSKTIGALVDDKAVAMQFDFPIQTESILDKIDNLHQAHKDMEKILATLLSLVACSLSPLQFSLSDTHSCAIVDSQVQCVGKNDRGELGLDPATTEVSSKHSILDFQTYASPQKVVTGNHFTCTLMDNGTVFCNGANGFGQLGYASGTDFFKTVQVWKSNAVLLVDVVDIEAGASHVCTILEPDSTMFCWGNDSKNLLGWNGHNNVEFMMLSSAATCIVLSDDRTKIHCKGEPNFHDKVYDMDQEVIKLSAGAGHFCALLANQEAKCFGHNNVGQLGNGSTDASYDMARPVLDASNGNPLQGITDINAGWFSTCVVSDGSPLCFGMNQNLQLGINGGGHKRYPTALKVSLPPSCETSRGGAITSIHVAETTGHVVCSDNSVYSWGINLFGNLGDGSEMSSMNRIGDFAGEAVVKMKFNRKCSSCDV